MEVLQEENTALKNSFNSLVYKYNLLVNDYAQLINQQNEEILKLKAENEAEILNLKAENEAEILNLKAAQEAEILNLKTAQEAEILNLKAAQEAEIFKLKADNVDIKLKNSFKAKININKNNGLNNQDMDADINLKKIENLQFIKNKNFTPLMGRYHSGQSPRGQMKFM